MRYSINFEGVLLLDEEPPQAPPAAEAEALLDLVVAELEEVGAEDISVVADADGGTISVSVSVVADDLESAQDRGNGTIRTAFHAAGAHTPGWTIDWTSASATREDDDHLIDA